MTRDILYKAKRIDNNKWVYGCYALIDGIHYIFENYEEQPNVFKTIQHEIKYETVSQFSGLEDMFGNLIFENDILFDGEKNIVVKFESGSFGYECLNIWMSFCHCYTNYNKLKVLGNIFND